ncbi:hypothetical protein [Clostridium sp. CTA-5]
MISLGTMAVIAVVGIVEIILGGDTNIKLSKQSCRMKVKDEN